MIGTGRDSRSVMLWSLQCAAQNFDVEQKWEMRTPDYSICVMRIICSVKVKREKNDGGGGRAFFK